MKKKLYGFVILHYLDFEMTKKCIDNILQKYGEHNIQIVVVDNASGNHSGECLKKQYEKNKNVNILINKENLGFAKGNNRGYQYIKKNYDADYIIILNNDVIINQIDFLEKVDQIYFKVKYDILGPDIYCPFTKKHQNPSRITPLTKNEIEELYTVLDERIRHYNKYYLKKIFLSLMKRTKREDQSVDYTQNYKNVVLHGACYIFSKKFIDACDVAFNPNTFLYLEEEILYIECRRRDFCMAYSPEVHVEHYEDVSTKKAFKSDYKRDKMKIKCQLDSIKILLDLMDNLEKKND